MPANEMVPYAFRTTAYLRTTKLLRRQKLAFALDVLWPDGRVDRNVIAYAYGDIVEDITNY